MGNKDLVCKVDCRSNVRIKKARAALAKVDSFRLSEQFKALANQTRIKIIHALGPGELCVCELADVLGLSIPATSQQLKILRQIGIINFRLEGSTVFYFLEQPSYPAVIKKAAKTLFGKD